MIGLPTIVVACGVGPSTILALPERWTGESDEEYALRCVSLINLETKREGCTTPVMTPYDPPFEREIKELKAGKSYQKHHGKSRWRGRCAPVCPECRVTLSRGECLNKLCKNFQKTLANYSG